MIWLTLAVAAYFLLALSAIGDKYLLSGTTFKNPGTYALLVGVLGFLLLLLVPFLGLPPPVSPASFLFAFFSGAVFILALIPFYKGLQKFQASSMVPATGALQPLFTLFLGLILLGSARAISLGELSAFVLLLLGGVFLTLEKNWKISKACLGLAALAAFLFALSFILVKQAYLVETFWSGLLWSRLGGGLAAALIFLCMPSVRREVFSFREKRSAAEKLSFGKTFLLFVATQTLGVLGGLLQQLSIYAAPVLAVPLINALQGVQYVFLFMFAIFASKLFPDEFREFYTPRAAPRKVIATGMIVAGVVLLIYFG